AAGGDRSDRFRRARVAGPLLDSRGDRGGRGGRDRRRQPRLLADRTGRREAPLRALGVPAPAHRAHPARNRGVDGKARRQGGLLPHHAFRQEVAGKPALARRLALGLALAVAVSGCGGGSADATVPTTVPHSVRVPDFTHVVLVVFENHEATSIAGNPDAPTFN